MSLFVRTCLPTLAALLWASTASAAAAPPSVRVDRVRVAPLTDSFSVFFREDAKRVQSADIARTGSVQTPKATSCIVGSAPKDLPNELGYDVVGGEKDYTILFSGVSLGSVHRGIAASAQACSGAPEASFQTHAPGVRLSQFPTSSKAVLLYGATPGNFLSYVDIERENGTHEVIEGRHDVDLGAVVKPVFVSGKIALVVYAAGTGLWAQTFDTEKGVAIDGGPKQLVTGLEEDTAVLAYPEGVDGNFRILFSRTLQGNEPPGIYEGHLRGGVFTKVLLENVKGRLVDGTLDTNGAQAPQQVLVTADASRQGTFVRMAIVDDSVEGPAKPVTLGRLGSETSVGCRARTCLIATAIEGMGAVSLIRITDDKAEPLPPIATTIPPYVGRPFPGEIGDAGTGTGSAANGESGCSVRSIASSETGCSAPFALGGAALFLARLRRSRRRF